MNILLALIILLIGLFGSWVHYLKVAKRSDVRSFFEYLFQNNTSGTTSTFFAFVSTMLAADKMGAFGGITIDSIFAIYQTGVISSQLATAAVSIFTVGYTFDSALNDWIKPETDVKP
jgi:uncharacterized membrane protein YbaN (DUF454 family)